MVVPAVPFEPALRRRRMRSGQPRRRLGRPIGSPDSELESALGSPLPAGTSPAGRPLSAAGSVRLSAAALTRFRAATPTADPGPLPVQRRPHRRPQGHGRAVADPALPVAVAAPEDVAAGQPARSAADADLPGQQRPAGGSRRRRCGLWPAAAPRRPHLGRSIPTPLCLPCLPG